ncbi:MAG: 23S rRNA (guanosine(2251)-2'-O)-methyltransferase RlmB [Deltaproteobacteria bacterium HGW-Deltaproteobacteria-19]|jgi:23S rRNA (guanosine2251-2'-O)-methyltransferase|nr:MAG: 23S rRNA (guanosine(2251)-2'-O)-methyltransferase RlmB [Deltaproteobacteria bacterium HGW-Deltaproteobacteria-19]
MALPRDMEVIYGVNPVLEALRSGELPIERVLIAKGRSGAAVEPVLKLAEERGIALGFTDRREIDKLAGRTSHQGVAALCRPYRYASLEEAAGEGNSKGLRLVVVLDGVTDPQNLGAIIRTACCFGASGVVIPEHRAAPVTPAVMKASAGAAGRIPVAQVGNLAQALDALKGMGFWVYGTDAAGGAEVAAVSFEGDAAVVMGSEGSGLRPLIRRKCDFLLSIPMGGGFDSLNVSVAAGIILYEISRRRNPDR